LTSRSTAEVAASPSFEQECVALFSGFLHVLGLPKSVGSIYGLLFASPVPLCFADIVDKLEFSKGSVSQGLTFLRQSGAVKPVDGVSEDRGRRTEDGRRATARREYFEPELGLRRLASGLLQEKIQPMSRASRAALGRLRAQASEARGVHKEFQMERIRQLETWNRQLGRILPVVKTLLAVSPR